MLLRRKVLSKKKYMNFQSCIGLRQLDELESMQKRRRVNAEIYSRALKDSEGVKVLGIEPEGEHVYWNYVILVENRSEIVRDLIGKGIDLKKIYRYDCNDYAVLKDFKSDCPVSKKVSESILGLPVFHYLRPEEANTVADLLREHFSDKREGEGV